ncbi:MAG TPA: thiopurine S-methyltransferase [Gammaproteobacteria bacterium]|nr:thiopurine S-methyltransferase [Gammaproteobacteria bacterium]
MTDWIQRWQEGKIGWHRAQVNSKLVEFITCLKLKQGDTVFVPLCGKSYDMVYLLKQGFKVIGVELSPLAIEQFFDENNLVFTISQTDQFTLYQGDNITLYCGDYFALDKSVLKLVSAVYDRAALIALAVDLREKYAQHLYSIISNDCRVLLLTLNYPQSQISGPPFAVDEDEVVSLFSKGFKCQQLQCFDDIKNELKFLRAGVDFIEKATYCLHKTGA